MSTKPKKPASSKPTPKGAKKPTTAVGKAAKAKSAKNAA
jgi:hypothetical protein